MRKRYIAVERLEAVATAALIGGYGTLETWRDTGRVRRRVSLSLAMDCENPYKAELFGRYSSQHAKRVKPMSILVEARCRKCARCLERKAMYWRGRAFTEYGKARRTFFGTLTTSPEWDVRLDCHIQVELAKRGVDFARLPEPEKFRERVKYGGAELTTYIKRLRGAARSVRRLDFRYLLIAEQHDSDKTSDAKRGRPHWHALFHEMSEEGSLCLPHELARDKFGNVRTDRYKNPILGDAAFLKREWKAGFSTWILAGTPQAATYCCKYLTKANAYRIRCSGGYGNNEHAEAVASESEAEKLDIPQRGRLEPVGE